MIKILIVDDHPIVRRGLKEIIADMPDAVFIGEAANGRDVLNRMKDEAFDLVILDIALPDIDGIDVLEQIKFQNPDCSVLMVSMYPEEQFAVRALKTGASGYLTKASAPDELILAIRKVLSGRKYVSSALAENLASLLQETERPPHELLSNREFQVVHLVVSGKTTTEIAEQLSLSVKTISTFRSRIFKKIGVKNHVELVKYALKHNLVS